MSTTHCGTNIVRNRVGLLNDILRFDYALRIFFYILFLRFKCYTYIFRANCFGTERARLVVQVKELRYAASRIIEASLLVSKKRRLPIGNFEPKYPRFWKLKLKKFFELWAKFEKNQRIFFSRKKVPATHQEIFVKTPDFSTWSWIFFRL